MFPLKRALASTMLCPLMVIYTAAVDLKYTYFPLQKKEE